MEWLIRWMLHLPQKRHLDETPVEMCYDEYETPGYCVIESCAQLLMGITDED